MNEFIDKPQLGMDYIVLFPHCDSQWGLWCDNPPVLPRLPNGDLSPENFNFTNNIVGKLESWLGYWRSYFIAEKDYFASQRWLPGSRVEDWLACGEEISDDIQQETGYCVFRLFRTYKYNPFLPHSIHFQR